MVPQELQTPLAELTSAVNAYSAAKMDGDQTAIDAAFVEYQTKYGLYRDAIRTLKKNNPNMNDADFFSDNLVSRAGLIVGLRKTFGHLNGINTRYVVMEVVGHHSGTLGAINELEFYSEGQLIPFTPLSSPTADFRRQGPINSWNDVSYNGKSNLNDGSYVYGGTESTNFNYGTDGDSEDCVSRAIIDLGQIDTAIDDIKIWTGTSTPGSVVKVVNFYELDDLTGVDQAALLDSQNTFKRLVATITTDLTIKEGEDVVTGSAVFFS